MFVYALLAWTAVAAEPQHTGFAEVIGGYGFQFGSTPYVPDEGSFKHPLTNGPSIGVAAGLDLSDSLAVLADYEYVAAGSRIGSIPNAVDSIRGKLQYHTITAGLRTGCKAGMGRVYGELAAGVVLPFDTELVFDYAAPLSQLPTPITGTGSMRSEYNLGFGGHGAMGYQWMIGDMLYVSGLVKLRLFSTNNADRKTVLNNFVPDFTAQPPTAVDATTSYSTDGTQPSTYSVQDARAQIAIGAYF